MRGDEIWRVEEQGVDAARWTQGCSPISTISRACPERAIGSVFFGGGTPSLMPPETVAALLDR